MTDSSLAINFNDKYEIVDRFNHWDPRNKRASLLLGIAIIMIFVPLAIFLTFWILMTVGYYSQYMGLWFLILAILLVIPMTFLHELIHFTFQWLFSKQRPELGFKCPYPYCKLRPNSSISRNQGIFSALSPFLVMTPIFTITIFFVNPIAQVVLIIAICLEIPTFNGDFLFSYWLLKRPKDTRLAVVNFDAVLFKDKHNK